MCLLHCNCLIYNAAALCLWYISSNYIFPYFLTKVSNFQSCFLLFTSPRPFPPRGRASVASNYPNFFISSVCVSPAMPKSTSVCSLTPSPKITDWTFQDEITTTSPFLLTSTSYFPTEAALHHRSDHTPLSIHASEQASNITVNTSVISVQFQVNSDAILLCCENKADITGLVRIHLVWSEKLNYY